MSTLQAGDKAPLFELKDQAGEVVKLADLAGQYVLIYFYPKADTPGCTIQSCSVRDASQDLAAQDIVALGISPDNPEAQAKFDTKFDLGFQLLADEEHTAAEAYGVWGEKSMYGKKYMGIIRSSFLVGKDGTIIDAWYKVKPDQTVPKALEALSAV